MCLMGRTQLSHGMQTGKNIEKPALDVTNDVSVRAGPCKVTGRRHRVSPCRSAYFASPWWLLTLDLSRHSGEAALLFPESWWHLTMRGSRPSLFMIIPNTKRHLNNMKTDLLPISEVITGLPRPYHNTSPPWWAANAEMWDIRESQFP